MRVRVSIAVGTMALLLAAVALLSMGDEPRTSAVDCKGYKPTVGFWQRTDDVSAEEATSHARHDIACLGLKGKTRAQVVSVLGASVPPENFGATEDEVFRVWRLDKGIGISIQFTGARGTADSVEERSGIDEDFWGE